MKFCWISDIHLDHLSRKTRDQTTTHQYYEYLRKKCRDHKVHAILGTGDYDNSNKLCRALQALWNCTSDEPFLFVLGNHDYYFSSFSSVTDIMHNFTTCNESLIYLTNPAQVCFPFPEEKLIVCGTDGWYDLGAGDPYTTFMLQDHSRIDDLTDSENPNQVCRDRAEFLTTDMAKKLNLIGDLFKDYKKMIFLTHVPIFTNVSLHINHEPSPAYSLPFFINIELGKLLLKFARENTHLDITVLCGHTHWGISKEIIPNLRVKVMEAVYGSPKFSSRIIDI